MSLAVVAPIDSLAGRLPRRCTVQVKLDGIRCSARLGHGRVLLRTKTGKRIASMGHIEAELAQSLRPGIEYDGELYAEDMGFERIQRAVLGHSQDSGAIGLHVFDVLGRSVRGSHVQRLAFISASEHVLPMSTEECSESEAKRLCNEILADGAEGAVVRPALAGYGKAWKVKASEDSEYTLTSTELSDTGRTVLVLLSDGGIFRMIATPGNWCVGNAITVRHQGLTASGIPRHASCPRVRLAE